MKSPEQDGAAALAARRDELAALGDDPIAQLIAADIGRQLAGRNALQKDALPPTVDETDAAEIKATSAAAESIEAEPPKD